jgi:hypothetical protein
VVFSLRYGLKCYLDELRHQSVKCFPELNQYLNGLKILEDINIQDLKGFRDIVIRVENMYLMDLMQLQETVKYPDTVKLKNLKLEVFDLTGLRTLKLNYFVYISGYFSLVWNIC